MPSRFHPQLKHRALTLWPLTLALFCLVSGGPYGLEPAILESGAGLALLLILLLPFIWALPVALMTAELTAAIPVEGAYYVWTKRAFGVFWGFQNAWWTWLYSMLDAAIYPVLFTTYLSSLLELWNNTSPLAEGTPGSLPLRIAINLAVIALFSWLNIRGTTVVGRVSVFLALMLIAPFLAMVLVGGFNAWGSISLDASSLSIPKGPALWTALSGGIYIVMWNFLGWDTLSTVAEEVDRPQRTFPWALMICLPLVALVYVLPVIVGLRFVPETSRWEEGAWPTIAREAAGPMIASWVNIVGLLSPIALFVTAVLGASRIPFVLAEDRLFPRGLLAVHPKYGTPWKSILFCAVIYGGLTTYFSFKDLIELNVTLYSASLVPELLALVWLRVKEPELSRPYKIPGGWPVLMLVVLLPLLVSGVGFAASVSDPEEGWADQIPVLALLASGPIVYWVIALWRRWAHVEAPVAPVNE